MWTYDWIKPIKYSMFLNYNKMKNYMDIYLLSIIIIYKISPNICFLFFKICNLNITAKYLLSSYIVTLNICLTNIIYYTTIFIPCYNNANTLYYIIL